MANNYYEMTGVLVLRKVTPIIEALFEGLNLDKDEPGNGEAYIAQGTDGCSPDWDTITENLAEIARQYDPEFDQSDSLSSCLSLLATQFGGEPAFSAISNLIEGIALDYDPVLQTLFDIAQCLDDGHGLTGLRIAGCWYCSKLRLNEFGGEGQFVGENVSVTTSSGIALELGSAVDAALGSGDIFRGAEHFLGVFNELLDGVSDEGVRAAVRQHIAEQLQLPR